MRIAHVVGRFAPHVGGIETHVRELSRRAQLAGHHVEVLTTDGGTLPARDTIDGVAVRRFPRAIRSECYALSPALWSYLRHPHAWDVVHVHGYHATSSLLAADAVRVPMVFSSYFHGTSDNRFRALLHRPYRLAGARIFGRADAVICLTAAEADLVCRYFPGAADRIRLISSGVDPALPVAPPMPAAAWGGGPLVLTAGRLVAYKHVEQVVAALDSLPGRYTLRVTGDGPARPAVAAAVAELGDPARAALLGWVPPADLHRWYRSAAVVVSLSHHESQGITLLEAIAAGAAVVASDIPAHRDVVRRAGGRAALVAPDAPAVAVASAIERVADRPIVPVAVPTWDDIATETLALYREVVGARTCRSVKARTDATQPDTVRA